jgi:transposase
MHVFDRQSELFQQDNSRPHTARLTMDYLEQNNINVLPWPSKSVDLNPIEHLWDHLNKRVRQRQPPPQTFDQLCQMLQQEWRTIPRNNLGNWLSLRRGSVEQCWSLVVCIHGTNLNVTGSVLYCDKLTFID